jgi:hypothetical protein
LGTAIKTGLVRGLDENALKNLLEGGHDWKTLDQGAATLIVAAFDPGLDGKLNILLDGFEDMAVNLS